MNRIIIALIASVCFLGIGFASPSANPSEGLMNSGERLFQNGRYDEALSFFERLIEKNPDEASAYVRIGDIYMLKNDSKRAAGYYSKALKISPQLCSAAIKLGKAYEKQGIPESAFDVYNSVISKYPSYSDAWLARGDLMLKRGAFERAISDFDASLKANPRNSAASLARGIAWLNKGALQRAVFDFDVVIMTYDGIPPSSVPGDTLAWAYYYRGTAYDKLDKNDPMRGSNYGYAVKAKDSFKSFLACPAPSGSEKEVAFAKTYLYSPDVIRAGVKADVVKVTLIGKDRLLITMQVVNSTDRTVTAVTAGKFDLYLDDDIIGRRNVTFTPEGRKYIMPGSNGFLYLSLPGAGRDFTNWSVTVFETQIHTI